MKPSTGDKGLKLSYSKSLFCEKTTEVRTLQNTLIGTIEESARGYFRVQNINNTFMEFYTYFDARQFILNSYLHLGKPGKNLETWQVSLF